MVKTKDIGAWLSGITELTKVTPLTIAKLIQVASLVVEQNEALEVFVKKANHYNWSSPYECSDWGKLVDGGEKALSRFSEVEKEIE